MSSLRLEGLSVAFGQGARVLDQVSWELKEG